jgi:rhamnose utilization protein RhaD (predicted bifunctional aldolase and dehydrogenase)/NAD(P)-dependent dehydrogenase (short-subunit alcohol dehydrogenase family)
VRSLFNQKDSKSFVSRYPAIPEELALCLYTSRLIGRDSNLVLHGGGNTSVKLAAKNLVGEEQEILYVKARGADLATIEPDGFVGLELDPLRKLRHLEDLSEEEMENELQIRKTRASTPDPSVEALLHAFLPNRYVNHTHADSILILTNQRNGQNLVRQVLGSGVAVLPYLKSGLPLAKAVVAQYERDSSVKAVVVLSHGIFTFADDARTSYEKTIEYVNRAEAYITKKTQDKSLTSPCSSFSPLKNPDVAASRFAQVVRGTCAHLGTDGSMRRFYVENRRAHDLVDASLSREAETICRSGVLTPDHVIRTKNWAVFIDSIPDTDEDFKRVVKDSVDAYVDGYNRYVKEHGQTEGMTREKLDPYPRVFLVAGLGLVALGLTRKAARVAADIMEHTVRAKLRGGVLGEYVPIAASHVFDMEYWSLQQRKLARTSRLPLEGQIAVVTGGGGAIGFGIADRLLASGAVVVVADIDEHRLHKVHSHLAERYGSSQLERLVFDVTDYQSVEEAFGEISRRIGGVDLVVPNAGIAHVAEIERLDPDKFDQVIAVNLRGTFNVIKGSIPVFRRQGTGGNIVVISSKNVFDPGASFGAYSASKAGAHQISKIAALELAELGVRVNMINPDAVFGDEMVSSKLWDVVGSERMKSRGLEPEGLKEYYRQKNLLKTRVSAQHVGNAVVFFASEQTPTTGATLPIDGGIPAAFPR